MKKRYLLILLLIPLIIVLYITINNKSNNIEFRIEDNNLLISSSPNLINNEIICEKNNSNNTSCNSIISTKNILNNIAIIFTKQKDYITYNFYLKSNKESILNKYEINNITCGVVNSSNIREEVSCDNLNIRLDIGNVEDTSDKRQVSLKENEFVPAKLIITNNTNYDNLYVNIENIYISTK